MNCQIPYYRAVEKRQVVDFIWPCSFPITQYVYSNNCLTKLTSRKDARLQGIIPKSQNHIGLAPKMFATLGGSNIIWLGKFQGNKTTECSRNTVFSVFKIGSLLASWKARENCVSCYF